MIHKVFYNLTQGKNSNVYSIGTDKECPIWACVKDLVLYAKKEPRGSIVGKATVLNYPVLIKTGLYWVINPEDEIVAKGDVQSVYIAASEGAFSGYELAAKFSEWFPGECRPLIITMPASFLKSWISLDFDNVTRALNYREGLGRIWEVLDTANETKNQAALGILHTSLYIEACRHLHLGNFAKYGPYRNISPDIFLRSSIPSSLRTWLFLMLAGLKPEGRQFNQELLETEN